MLETTGRCHTCNTRYVWRGKPLLRDAHCPKCHASLQLTTHLFKSGPSEFVDDRLTLVRA